MSIRRIGQDQDVFILFMFEIVINPLLFEKSGDEIEIRLPVLNAVVPFVIGPFNLSL